MRETLVYIGEKCNRSKIATASIPSLAALPHTPVAQHPEKND